MNPVTPARVLSTTSTHPVALVACWGRTYIRSMRSISYGLDSGRLTFANPSRDKHTAAPFGEDIAGLAWDGENLWALDSRNQQVNMIERENQPTLDDAQ